MLVDLVRTYTSDGHRLDGAVVEPSSAVAPSVPLDAIVLLHGVGGNFYAGSLFDHLTTAFAGQGLVVLRVNTRGHDSISMTFGRLGPVRQGAAYELVDDCRRDVRAWVDFLRERGHSRIGLLGHSLGALKAIYSQALEPLPAIRCVIACSAPRLSYSAFMNSEAQPQFWESFSAARDHVQRGQPDALVWSKYPAPVLITAAGYLDKYGPEERYNFLPLIERVTCPLLTTYGEMELESGGVAFAGLVEAVQQCRRAGQTLWSVSVPGADHAYSGVFPALSQLILKWLVEAVPVAD